MLPFHITVTILFSRTSVSSQTTKKVFLINKKALHMIDDIFWYTGFKNAEAGSKVYVMNFVIIMIILIILIILTASSGVGHS